jgi:T5SS/PEP-CTERM-associated repeat protein
VFCYNKTKSLKAEESQDADEVFKQNSTRGATMNRFLAAKRRRMSVWLILLAAIFLAGTHPSARADIIPIGDVSPDPSTWDSSTTGYIGNTASGTVTINAGSDLLSSAGIIANYPGSTGVVTVDGAGSTWTNSGLNVGNCGSGTLSISGGGSVQTAGSSLIGFQPGSTGVITVDGANSTWTTNGGLTVGYYGNGTLLITNGGSVNSTYSTYIGSSGSKGVLTVDGAGSTWANGSILFIGGGFGSSGSATLSITNGGSVTNTYNAYIGAYSGPVGGSYSGSMGVVSVDGADSTWSCAGALYMGGEDFMFQNGGSGTLSITNGGCVTSSNTYIGYSPGSKCVVTVDGVGSTWNSGTSLNVGSYGNCALSITNGGSVTSGSGTIGYSSQVTVDGGGSTWNDQKGFVISGGTLSITRGGTVSVGGGSSTVGSYSGIPAVVTVDGAGSTWNTATLVVGNTGSSSLSITNGGSVNSSYANTYGNSVVRVNGHASTWVDSGALGIGGTLSITSGGSVNSGELVIGGQLSITGGGAVVASTIDPSRGLIAVDVGRGSSFTLTGGSSSASNILNLRILAGAGVAADGVKYSPVSAPSWSTAGRPYSRLYQAIGGTWDTTNHTFTASSVTAGMSGSPVALDLASIQRALIDDNGPGGTNWELGASFLAGTSTTNITFTALATGGTPLDGLKSVAGSDQAVLDAWTFATTNYSLSATNPIYFSLKVGPNFSTDDLELWGYNGTSWAAYIPTDLTYDGTYASFTATGLSGYAATAVPEPGTLVLLAAGFLGLAAYARRKQRRP